MDESSYWVDLAEHKKQQQALAIHGLCGKSNTLAAWIHRNNIAWLTWLDGVTMHGLYVKCNSWTIIAWLKCYKKQLSTLHCMTLNIGLRFNSWISVESHYNNPWIWSIPHNDGLLDDCSMFCVLCSFVETLSQILDPLHSRLVVLLGIWTGRMNTPHRLTFTYGYWHG